MVNKENTEHSPGFASCAIPEVKTCNMVDNSYTGVSTRYAHNEAEHWYALRTTYGREKLAYEYILNKGGKAFYPTIRVTKEISGKRKVVEESRLPNIFFAYGTENKIKEFVYDNIHLPFLRFYYHYFRQGGNRVKEPMIIPNRQMESLMIICKAESENIIISSKTIEKFAKGQPVRITEGKFKGVMGRVARYQGQQRVAVEIEGLMTVITAYVPSAFLKYEDQLAEKQ